jgi:hypothetical protein
MVVWGVVSSEIEQVIEFIRTRREAERMLAVSYTNIVLTDTTNNVSTRVPDASRTFFNV